MPYDSKAIANYFIDLSIRDGRPITPMQLQKLVFFAHGWCLALTDEPLIDEQVEAWKFGPVIRNLYGTFREYGNQPITSKYQPLDMKLEDGMMQWSYQPAPSIEDNPDRVEFTKKLLDKIWEVYGRYTAFQLSNMTHAPGTPWDTVVKQHGGNPPKYTDIPAFVIRDYFAELGKRNKNAGTQ